MSRQIPESIVQRFIKLDKHIDKLAEERSQLKEKLRLFNNRGYESPLLRFQDSTTWRPDWKKLVHELAAKYMTSARRRVYFSKLKKRFPRKHIATSIIILSKERRHEGVEA